MSRGVVVKKEPNAFLFKLQPPSQSASVTFTAPAHRIYCSLSGTNSLHFSRKVMKIVSLLNFCQ
jgi:hypothetical protein